jgi:predicted molibdopterin-dependent oxidoreductase YjgC
MARELIARGAVDTDFVLESTSGFEEFSAFVADFTPERVLAETGLLAEQYERAIATIAEGERVSFWWTQGVNQSHQSTRTSQAIIDLALLTGNIGRPGTGANSITGQCNAMGSRLFSNTASLFGGRDTTNPDHRREVAEILGIDVATIPDRPSMAYDQIVEGIARGTIHGLWIIGTNPAHSWINHEHLREMFDRLDFLVVQDLYADTETARRADLFLPAAGWAEKDGTFINSERRIGRVRRAHRPPGQSRTDFEILQGIAEAWGCGPMFRRWATPAKTFDILRELSRDRPCDFTGVSGYEGLGTEGVQWPWPEGSVGPYGSARPEPERRLFADGRFLTPDGRARFVWEEPVAPPERPSNRYPLVLLTGRGSTAQWHTQTRTGRSPVLMKLSPARLYLELSPDDAAARNLRSGDMAWIDSRRASIVATVFVTPTLAAGQVFLPMHDPTVNALTAEGFDPHSRQPSYKYSAVQVRSMDR